MRRETIGKGLLLLALSFSGPIAHAAEFDCGSLDSTLGPFDYNDPAQRVPNGENPMGMVKRVENVHFQPDLMYLNIKRFFPDRLHSEFLYTLGIFPNHRLALNSFSRLEHLYGKQLSPAPKRQTADCAFDRAIRFRPEDKSLRFVYGLHLHQAGKLRDALKEYELAESLGEDSGNFYYNYGLLLTDLKNWDLAQKYAEKAYASGISLPGLANKLQRSGHPRPPSPPASPVSPAAETPSRTEEIDPGSSK